MLTLLAESKTMTSLQMSVSQEDFKRFQPPLEKSADELMKHLEGLSPHDISNILGISGQLAIKTHNLAFEFPHKMTGQKALESFTGEAYRSLDISSFSKEELDRANQNLRIISSVYGILEPLNIIKPYRFEFNKPLWPDNKTSIQIFKPKVTIELAKLIKEEKIGEIIDLLPADADKCIDWKILRAFTKVYKVCFQQMLPDGTLKTPIAKRLKELRGLMARTIFKENIQSFKNLISYNSNYYVFSPEHSKTGLPVFITD